MDQQAPLLAVELLADRNKRAAALCLRAQAPELCATDETALAGLAASVAVFFVPSGTEADERLQRAGCRVLEEEKWLAGDWYLAPPPKPSQSQLASRALALRMVQLVSADADNHEIEALLRQDPALSYHLLKLVNSLGVGAGRKITGFGQAILILGRNQLRRWLNLMLFSSREGDERAPMLTARAAMRARCMELLARQAGLDRSAQDQAFIAGMFSLLGVLFGMPLDEVLMPLRLNDAVAAALLRQQGELAGLLRLAEAAEAADFAALPALLAALSLPYADFNASVLQAGAWAMEVAREQSGASHG